MVLRPRIPADSGGRLYMLDRYTYKKEATQGEVQPYRPDQGCKCAVGTETKGRLVSAFRLFSRVPMASPTLIPRFGGQSYRKLITAFL